MENSPPVFDAGDNNSLLPKRKGETLEKEQAKCQKVVDFADLAQNHFQELPNEIIRQIALLSESLAALLLSLTCSRIYNLFNRDNRLWHSIYMHERQIHVFSLKNTIATDVFGHDGDMVSRHFERETESLQPYECPLTVDCIDAANEIVAEEESFNKYFQLRFYDGDDNLLKYPRKNVSFTEYSAAVNYKKLALKNWFKFNQFEMWNVQKRCVRLFKYKNCTCFGFPDLEIKDDFGESIKFSETNDDELNSLSEDDSSENSDDSEFSDNHSSLSLERCDLFLDEISTLKNFKFFLQVLSGIIIGHSASPACKHSYQIRVAKMFETNPKIVKDVSEDNFQHIQTALNCKSSFECISRVVCALQKFSMADLLIIHGRVKTKFPYLSTICSALDIEENIPYVWPFFATHHEVPWSFHFQPDFATKKDHETMPDWLSLRHSMLKLFRRAGIFCATPNSSEYAVDTLSGFIKRILEAVLKSQPTGAQHFVVTEGVILQAIKSQVRSQNYNTTTVYSTSIDMMQDDAVVTYSDSEISSDDDSSFEDPSAIDDLEEFFAVDSNNDDEDEELPDEFTNLNDLIKKSVPGLDNDESPLCMQTAVLWAQSDVGRREISEFVGTVEDDEKEDQEHDQYDIDDEDIPYSEGYQDLDEALQSHSRILQTTHKLDNHHYGTVSADATAQDPVMKSIDNEDRVKIVELRSETNRILKEETEKEFQTDWTRSFKRMESNYLKYVESRPEPLACKSMEIFLNSKGALLRQTIEKAITIIGNASSLKVVKLMWLRLEQSEKSQTTELLDSLMTALSKCHTLKKLILEDYCLESDSIRSALPNIEIVVVERKPKMISTNRWSQLF